MKRTLCSLLLLLLISSHNSYAALVDRGGGMIYDSTLNVTWLQNANYAATELSDARVQQIISAVPTLYGHTLTASDFLKDGNGSYTGRMTWWAGLAWTDQLVYGGYSDWRLPNVLPVNGSNYNYTWSINGATDRGYNISAPRSAFPGSTGSEMANLFYDSLKNKGLVTVDGYYGQPGWGLQNTGPFSNIDIGYYYWTSKEYHDLTDTDHAMFFNFMLGSQSDNWRIANQYAWAVRSGDVAAVPLPAAVWLLGSGLIGLIGLKNIKRTPSHSFRILALVAVFALTFVGFSEAALVDQVNSYMDASFEDDSVGGWQQEVTVGMAGYLVGIDLYWYRKYWPYNNQIFFAVNVGSPWQSDANDFQSIVTFTNPNGWNYIDVSSAGLYFLAGDKFVFIVQNPFDNTSMGGSWPDMYTNGNLFVDGHNFADGGWDLAFRTHMNPVPLPSAVLLFGSGLVVVWGRIAWDRRPKKHQA
jgi:hypothetical protein